MPFYQQRNKLRNLLCSLLLILISSPAFAANILAIISPANGADALHGAHQLLKQQPNYQIQLRTSEQFMQLTRAEQLALWQQADLVFAGAIYGDAVVQINSLIPQAKAFIAVHSDRKLVRQSHINQSSLLSGADLSQLMAHPPLNQDASTFVQQQLQQHAQYQDWLLAKSFWSGRSGESFNALFRHLNKLSGEQIDVPAPKALSPIRFWQAGKTYELNDFKLTGDKPALAILDYETGDRPGEQDLLQQICQQAKEFNCFAILARWGEASLAAVKWLVDNKSQINAVTSLQNFVIGSGDNRQAVNQQLAKLNLPIIKAIRLTDSSKPAWVLSEQGLNWDSVHYRVAMPELQGISQPLVVAAMSATQEDVKTGLLISQSKPIEVQVKWLAQRLKRWATLASKANQDKKVAIIYYNHPPGRHNIGADNLNVPASLFEILNSLKAAGYNTGELPASEEKLLDLLQEKGVNLPENNQALREMAGKVTTVSKAQYQQWFSQLSPAIQAEMQHGPLAYLDQVMQQAKQLDDKKIAVYAQQKAQ